MEIRKAQRQAFCRACDKKIQVGESMLSMYSWRNRGQNIHICLDCVDEIHEMSIDHKNKEKINEHV